jgi:hypothetical protein
MHCLCGSKAGLSLTFGPALIELVQFAGQHGFHCCHLLDRSIGRSRPRTSTRFALGNDVAIRAIRRTPTGRFSFSELGSLQVFPS